MFNQDILEANQCATMECIPISTEVAGILELGQFSIVVQLIRRPTTTEHYAEQFVNQELLLSQHIKEKRPAQYMSRSWPAANGRDFCFSKPR